uniref:Bidirectional sugar transporter SWEET n=1 Tax=Arundo donax TaxID=35708 RepID=A0A0A9CN22_ARUDO
MLWIFYAFLKSGAELLITINGVGCVIETAYIAMYLVYAPKASRLLTAKMFLGLNVGLFGFIALVTMLLSSHGTIRVHVLGWICVSVALAVFAAPLSIMRLVIRTKSVEFMPFSLSFCLVLSAVIWFAYGALKKDVFVAVPNVLGFVFGVAQMALYMAYRNRKPKAAVVMVEEVKLPEHVKEAAGAKTAVAAAATAPEGRSSCGAEVHPIDELAPPAPVAVAHEHAVVIDVEPISCAAAAAAGADADGGVDGDGPSVPRVVPEPLTIKLDTAIAVKV